MDDDDLVARVAAGDDTALRELFGRHAPWLAVRLRAVLPAADVEDVLQETFLAAWRGARGYRPQGACGGWLWGIARRQAALLLRRRGPADQAVTAAWRPGKRPDSRALPTQPRPRWPGPTSRWRSRPWGRPGARNVRCGGSCTNRTGR
jgi:DNA-directed RNA polymerase specialized sigma24 family protein